MGPSASETLSDRPGSWKDLPPADPEVTGKIISWYRENRRDFPWRRTRNPWLVLCAELMLQRTRASQVEPVFRDFAGSYSGPADVVRAGSQKVKNLFGRLGLLWRAEYFFQMQRELIERFDGEVPDDPGTLLGLPGVGDYASTAVRVFAFGASETVVDSNVLRMAGRYFGISFPDHARRSPRLQKWLSELAPEDPEEVREFNWGLIDFAAEVCRPGEPLCGGCCLRDRCWFAREQRGE